MTSARSTPTATDSGRSNVSQGQSGSSKVFTLHVHPYLLGKGRWPTISYMVTEYTALAFTDQWLRAKSTVAKLVEEVNSKAAEVERLPVDSRTQTAWAHKVTAVLKEIDDPHLTVTCLDRTQARALEELPHFRMCSNLSNTSSRRSKPFKLQVAPFLDGQWPAWTFYTSPGGPDGLTDMQLGDQWPTRHMASRINETAEKYESLPPEYRTYDKWNTMVRSLFTGKPPTGIPSHRDISFGVLSPEKEGEIAKDIAAIKKAAGKLHPADIPVPSLYRRCDSSTWTALKRDAEGRLL